MFAIAHRFVRFRLTCLVFDAGRAQSIAHGGPGLPGGVDPMQMWIYVRVLDTLRRRPFPVSSVFIAKEGLDP
jgi:hypothetical protein